MPTLALHALYDFELPVETAQRPLFELLATPAQHKRHRVFESGHSIPVDDVVGHLTVDLWYNPRDFDFATGVDFPRSRR